MTEQYAFFLLWTVLVLGALLSFIIFYYEEKTKRLEEEIKNHKFNHRIYRYIYLTMSDGSSSRIDFLEKKYIANELTHYEISSIREHWQDWVDDHYQILLTNNIEWFKKSDKDPKRLDKNYKDTTLAFKGFK